MRLFRSHRYDYSSSRTQKKTVLIILASVAAAALILTIIIGNLLKIWLSDEALAALINKKDETEQSDPIYLSSVRDVHAYSFVFSSDLEPLLEHPSVSVSLNTPSGEMTYTSTLTDRFSLPLYRTAPLEESMGDLKSAANYISGVFYSQAFHQSDESLFDAEAAIEQALLREFFRSGGNEVILSDLPFGSISEDRILSYIQGIKRACGRSIIGVSLPIEVATGKESAALLEKLLKVTDFLALDLRESSLPISECHYYLEQYDMRLLLDSTQKEQIDIARATLPDFQIVTHPPAKKTEE